MDILELLRVAGSLVFLLLPGLLLTYLFFPRDDLTHLERIPLGFAISVAFTTLLLYAANKILGIALSPLTVVSIVSAAILASTAALWAIRSRRRRLSWPALRCSRAGLKVHLGLVLVLAFAFFMAFIPHLDYSLPLHIDEWNSYAWAQAIVEAQSLSFAEPFFGEMTAIDHPEIGFHLFLSQAKLLSDLPWQDIFRFLPGTIFLLTVLTAFVFGHRGGFGLAAAFFVALLPTSVRFLGPSFLVPVALGLLLLGLILFILHYQEVNPTKALVLLLLLAFLYLSHPPTGAAASLVCLAYGFAGIWRRWRDAHRWRATILVWGSALVTVPIGVLRNWDTAADMASGILRPADSLPLIVDALPRFGIVPLIFLAAGAGFLVMVGKRSHWGLVASCLAFISILIIFAKLNVGVPIIYDRSYLYLMLVGGLIAGYGMTRAREACEWLVGRFSPHALRVSWFVVATLVASSAAMSLQSHLSEPYYQLITQRQYLDSQWIRHELDSGYRRILTDPRIAIAFGPLSGKYIYASDAAVVWHSERIKPVLRFLDGGEQSLSWLAERDIDIVYTESPIEISELQSPRENVYLVPKNERQ